MNPTMLDSWYSGQVQRKHTMVNIRAENVAEHTWGVVMILMMLWPEADKRMFVLAQFHDFGELATGDVPGPVKWANPEVSELFDEMEDAYTATHLSPTLRQMMTDCTRLEKLLVEFADRVEFCFSMSRERRMGNTFAMSPYMRSYNKGLLSLKAMREERLMGKESDLSKRLDKLWLELNDERDDLGKLGHG